MIYTLRAVVPRNGLEHSRWKAGLRVKLCLFCLLSLLLGDKARPICFVWFFLARLPTETARISFLNHFLKKRNGFFLVLSASRTCSMPRQDFFRNLVSPSHSHINFPPFCDTEGKTLRW